MAVPLPTRPNRFVQSVPDLPDTYASDVPLQRLLDRYLGEVGHKTAAPALERLAAEAPALRAAGAGCEAHPPVLRQYDGWGARVDRVDTDPGWERLRVASAEHGLVALPWEADARSRHGAGARVLQLALLHLMGPESATYNCPVAMSDGAAAMLHEAGVNPELDSLRAALVSRDPAVAVTSGQWMTETEGGSDVGQATTRAHRDAGGQWTLHGEKWFCSAVTSEVAVALARPGDSADGGGQPGTAGLAAFVVPRYAGGWTEPAGRQARRTADGLVLHRLKDKLGTRALPSAEVGLDGAWAIPVAADDAERGIRRMMTLVQVTRLHNAAAAAAGMRRGVALARAFAGARRAFGVRLDQQPLHRETLAGLAVDAEASLALTALAFSARGTVELAASPTDAAAAAALLRLAATLAKSLTGRLAVAVASEVVESFGGGGYIEDTGVPRLLRDAQVLPIWEGTTNIQALDVLRALADPRVDALGAVLDRVDAAIERGLAAADWLPPVARDLQGARDRIADAARAAGAAPAAAATQAGARALAHDLGCLLAAAALVEQGAFELDRGDARGALVASLWVRRRLLGDPAHGEGHRGFAHLVDGAAL